jgi:formate hydrogenlyase subunit 6/NADH:ubiquinone oxidoreductase subunit I
MAIDERHQDHELNRARKQGFGQGLVKGLFVTFKHLFKRNTVIQYPDEKQDLPARTRGVIALKEENCTVCMLCGRECPDWCIYIDSHKETLPPKREGGRPRKRNVLDRFAIDYALCMYCGICVEVCPYDALFWSREFEYAEYDIRELTHEKEKLSDWMATVLPPPELEEGAELPGQPPAAQSTPQDGGAPAPTITLAPTGARPATTTSSAAEARPEQAQDAPKEGTFAPQAERPVSTLPESEQATETDPARAEAQPAPGLAEDVKAEEESASSVAAAGAPPAQDADVGVAAQQGPAEPEAPSEQGGLPGSTETARPSPPDASTTTAPAEEAPAEDPEEVYRRVRQEQMDKGSSPQVAEARAKVARVKAQRGVRRETTPVEAPVAEPSAPTEGRPAEPEPSGAPRAAEPEPEQGPVAPTAEESGKQSSPQPPPPPAPEQSSPPPPPPPAPSAAPSGTSEPAQTPAGAPSEDPEAVYERILAEERAKGVSEAVAMGRAKAARVRAQRAQGGG